MVERVFWIPIILFHGEYIYFHSLFNTERPIKPVPAMQKTSNVSLEVLQETDNLTANHFSCAVHVETCKHRSVANAVMLLCHIVP